MIFLNIIPAAFLAMAGAQEPGATPLEVATSSALPTYLSLTPNINDFGRFADGGADGNWYVGFNNAWIVKLPPAPPGDFSRAFIGAKIGRAKTRPNPDKPWLRELINGKIYMAVSQKPAFSSEQSYFLTETSDVPLEADPESYVAGIDSSQWFWAEVPTAMVSFTQANYLIVWSPTDYFLNASSSPILAAAEAEGSSSRESLAWNNHSILGVPPRSEAGALETPLYNLHPGLAIKLVPAGEDEVTVSEFSARRDGKNLIVQFSAGGEDVSEAWVEVSRDQLDWERTGPIRRREPYIFTLPADKTASPGWYLRGAARDISGDVGTSDPVMVPNAQ